MKNLTKYIKESIFDIDDNIDKLKDVAELHNWIRKFSDFNKFDQNTTEFLTTILKEGSKIISRSKIKGGEYMVKFIDDENGYYHNTGLYIYYPASSTTWRRVNVVRREVKDYLVGKRELENKIEFNDFKNSVTDISLIRHRNQSYYTLPKKYIKLIELIREKSK